MVVWAPPCSTWVAINVGTSKRSILCPGGDPTLLQNRKANKTACRNGLEIQDVLLQHLLFFSAWYGSCMFFSSGWPLLP